MANILCSKLTTETLEQGANMSKVNNKDTRTTCAVFELTQSLGAQI